MEDVVKSPDVSAWKQALYEAVHSSSGFRVLSLDGTMKIAMGLRRYETKIPGGRVRTLDDVVDHNTCVLTIRTLEDCVLDLAVFRHDCKPCNVQGALEDAIQRRPAEYHALAGSRQRECSTAYYTAPLFPGLAWGRVGYAPPADEI